MALAQGFAEHPREIECTVVTETPAEKASDSNLRFQVVRQPSLFQLARLIQIYAFKSFASRASFNWRACSGELTLFTWPARRSARCCSAAFFAKKLSWNITVFTPCVPMDCCFMSRPAALVLDTSSPAFIASAGNAMLPRDAGGV